jgi:hypothetical protein
MSTPLSPEVDAQVALMLRRRGLTLTAPSFLKRSPMK